MIQIKNLSFAYKRGDFIIHELNMYVPKGAIYGFVGANAAGKSTTIRLLLRALKAKCGTILINGEPLKNIHFEKIGFLIDGPVFYDHLTCFQNLKLLYNYYPNVNESRIEDVLSMVGLLSNQNYLYKNCSTGMKQRLGIAKALIHKPELLILDEPLNGLDPEWVIYIRNILVEINKKYNTTIFFTNHILSEVEKIATHIGILKDGRLIIESRIEDILKNVHQSFVLITCNNIEHVSSEMIGIPFKRINNDQLLFNISEENLLNDILSKVIEKGIIIENIEVKGNDLETIFLKLLN